MANALQVDFLAAGITDTNGNPLNGGKVYTYEAGTTTPKTCWTAADKSAAATNPVILNARGQAALYADGNYKFVIKDASDNAIITLDNMHYVLVTALDRAIKAITGNYVVEDEYDVIFGNAAGGNIIVTLPTAVGNDGRELIIKKTDSSAFTVTIDGAGTETIEGSLSIILTKQYEALYIVSNGANWVEVITNYQLTGWPPTATPTPTRIPIAGVSGKLASGWLHAILKSGVISTHHIADYNVTRGAHYYAASGIVMSGVKEKEIGTLTVQLFTIDDSVWFWAKGVITTIGIAGAKSAAAPVQMIFRIRRNNISGTILDTSYGRDIYPPVFLLGSDLPSGLGSQVYVMTVAPAISLSGSGTDAVIAYRKMEAFVRSK